MVDIRDERAKGFYKKIIKSVWAYIVVMALFTIGLGFLGFKTAYPQKSFLDIFYLTIQLFVLESGAIVGDVKWPLEIARLLAPIVMIGTGLKTVAIVFRNRLGLFLLKYYNGHIIICGLGQKGFQIAKEFHKAGEKVVGGAGAQY